MSEAVRLDKWLWSTRFFKTRSLAQQAIRGGKVEINGQKPKASRLVRVEDRLQIGRGELLFEVVVIGLAERRVSAEQARALYEETAESIERREAQLARKREAREAGAQAGRPDKRQRRALERLRSRNR
ncbi:RNA-binding S4 domain-containing protein [Wenzhouxiangella marina]|uniref:Heat shock protein 15 n=1 Tax=Wenzhouxiangella marina TaxID=1579979 RepID=A0A0K0XWJ9_9GAMM|nr:S4 domain-containing protein [Wenzhouxiangella marina]AKS41991.1 Heat shock protein 15 [Wenzhouxiangella marina]MBB6086242.1 ribosome-associated heat shock protein Hsp15 [Wenzhouxiangella marina]